MTLHLLVKDYGEKRFSVHGVTTEDAVAQAWEAADTSARRIFLDTEAFVDPLPAQFAERI